MNKEIIKIITDLNKTHNIKIKGIDKERLIFDNEEIFKIYGGEDKVLNPFNEPTYEELNNFFYDLIDYLKYNEELTEENFFENVTIEPLIYNSDLLNWLNSNLNNSYYVDEAMQEYGTTDKTTLFDSIRNGNEAFKREIYSNAFNLTIEYLKKIEVLK